MSHRGFDLAGEAGSRVLAALQVTLKGAKKLRAGSVVAAIRRQAPDLSDLQIVEGLGALAREGVITGVTPGGAVLRMVGWTHPPEVQADSFAPRWAMALAKLPPEMRPALARPPRGFEDLSDGDLAAFSECLARSRHAAPVSGDRYVVSANLFMGSSKLIDLLPDLGIAVPEHRPLFVVTAGPASPRTILFVENPSAFASLMSTNFIEEHMVICAFGYGLTIENLPARLQTGGMIPCAAAGVPPRNLSKLVASTPCFYWGDLDLEGLRIFEGMRAAIPHLRLARIYRAMADRLSDPARSHPYTTAFGKKDHRRPAATAPLIARLAELCAERAVDQEALCPVREIGELTEAYDE